MVNPGLLKENFTRKIFSDHGHHWLLLQAKIKRELRLKNKIGENVISFKNLFVEFFLEATSKGSLSDFQRSALLLACDQRGTYVVAGLLWNAWTLWFQG